MTFGDERERFAPLQSGAFALGVVRRVAPCVEAVEPRFCFAARAPVLAVHVQTISAAVDLRRAHPDKIEQPGIEVRVADLPFEAEHGLHNARVHVREIDSSLHCLFPSIDQDDSE
jgi:hypothetical protein